MRYRVRIGKGRKGLRLKVFSPDGKCVIDHDTSQTYRTVREAIEQAERLFPLQPGSTACKHAFPRQPTHERAGANGSVKVYLCNKCLAVKVIQKRAQDWTIRDTAAVETIVEVVSAKPS
jgi:hypothetical protein